MEKPYKSNPGGKKAEFGGICRSSFAALVGLVGKRGLSWHHIDLFQRWMLDFLTHHITGCYSIRATVPPDHCFIRWIILALKLNWILISEVFFYEVGLHMHCSIVKQLKAHNHTPPIFNGTTFLSEVWLPCKLSKKNPGLDTPFFPFGHNLFQI